tara:strand:+ start:2526 stop:3518 length:993 start_codon:yes stop_codon:yes gene_type:complete
MFDIQNRRYIGSKATLSDWIFENIPDKYKAGTFVDIFAGTGVIAKNAMSEFNKVIINDFLYSNFVIYTAFFGKGSFSKNKLENFFKLMNDSRNIESNYVSKNYGDKYFSKNTAKKIGFIREEIENKKYGLNKREKSIALASLLYSADKIALTVGHYEVFHRQQKETQPFIYSMIQPYKNTNVEIYREDSNKLVKKIKGDIFYVDPPYNSRQYSRFYHVLETITKWDKPKLEGVAMKPPTENASEYSKTKAPVVFKDLINNIDAKLIVVSYNNTYKSKSSSSKNKIELEEIEELMKNKGKTEIISRDHKFFTSGKTSFNDHKEFLFITKVS